MFLTTMENKDCYSNTAFMNANNQVVKKTIMIFN